jgi:uncharacterized surface protein with fasciclin (FAS1) repeats
MRTMNKKYIQSVQRMMMIVMLYGLLYTSCSERDIEKNYYTFTGEMITDYLKKRSDKFSLFYSILEKANLTGVLDAYGSYTCFAPTNEAVSAYMQKKGYATVDGIPQDEIFYIAYNCIVQKAYLTTDLVAGAIPTVNMYDRYLLISFNANSTTGALEVNINNQSKIIRKDDQVENGVIHTIDAVLTPSNFQLPEVIAQYDELSIFYQALVATGLADSLRKVEDLSYVSGRTYLDIGNTGSVVSPAKRKYGYTVFIETNKVFNQSSNGKITDLSSLNDYAKGVYPDGAGIDSLKDPESSLYQFMSYHILKAFINYNKFVYKATYQTVPNTNLYEYYETMASAPPALLKVMDGTDGIRINRRKDDQLGIFVKGIKILSTSENEKIFEQSANNGIFHCIDDILLYNSTVKNVVLNDRLRMDATSLLPEMMTNGLRQSMVRYCFPAGYFDNITFKSDTRLYYLGNYPGSWINYQGDEMMAVGQYDFTLRLPPVPPGTYEVRFGFSSNNLRGVAQFYFGSSLKDLKPVGIPLDLRVKSSDPAVGWVSDASATDNGIENDKMLRARGWMKGGTEWQSYSGGIYLLARDHDGALRRIIGTFDLDEKAHYIRFKNVLQNSPTSQFMFDYIEMCPKSVYASYLGEDRL